MQCAPNYNRISWGGSTFFVPVRQALKRTPMLLIASTVLPAADRVTLSSSTLSKNRIYLISVSSSCMYSLLISTLIARRLSVILPVLLATGIAIRDELLCNKGNIIFLTKFSYY